MASNTEHSPNRSRGSELHPAVYLALVGCAVAMGLGVWLFAAGGAGFGLAFPVVGLFTLAAVAIPAVMARFVCRREDHKCGAFREWLRREFEIDGFRRVNARSAVTMILVGPLAGALGLCALGLVAALVAT